MFTPTTVVQFEVVGFTILTLVGGRGIVLGIAGLPVPGSPGTAADAVGASAGRRPRGRATSAKVKNFKGISDGVSGGDTSRTWRWPGTTRLDSATLQLPVRTARFSPLLSRVLIDGSYLRAMFGAASLLLPAAGVVLGALALQSSGGYAVPPTAALLATLAVIGVFDALAGFLGAAVFVVGVAASGGLDSAAGIRTMLGLGVVWFAVPLIAGAARPLRRLPAQSVADHRKRAADFVIASLIAAWAIQKMIGALPGLAEQPLPVARDATMIALMVLGASVARIGLEGTAGRWYPQRLAAVQPASVPRSDTAQRIAAACLRTAIFLFVAIVFIGDHWQLWAGGALFLLPQLLSIYENKFRNSEALYRCLPRGLLKLVLMLCIGTASGALVLRLVQHSQHASLDAFVLLAVPGVAFSILELFGREGHDPDEGWARWLGGCALLAIGVLFAVGYLG